LGSRGGDEGGSSSTSERSSWILLSSSSSTCSSPVSLLLKILIMLRASFQNFAHFFIPSYFVESLSLFFLKFSSLLHENRVQSPCVSFQSYCSPP
jgi:hypothetical protein